MTHHFPTTIVKRTADGTQALSSYLEEGETLLDGTTYAQVMGTAASESVVVSEPETVESTDESTETEGE